MVNIGASVCSAIGFSDDSRLTGMGADIGKKVSSDFANRITEDTNTSPGRIRYFGDPISAFDFQATTVMFSFKQRWKQSAHSYSGLEIADKAPLHDNEKPINTIIRRFKSKCYNRVVKFKQIKILIYCFWLHITSTIMAIAMKGLKALSKYEDLIGIAISENKYH